MSVSATSSGNRGRPPARHPELWALLVIVLWSLGSAGLSNGAKKFVYHIGGPDLWIPHTFVMDGSWHAPVPAALGILRLNQRLADKQCRVVERLSERHQEIADRLASRIEERGNDIDRRANEQVERHVQRLEESSERLEQRLQEAADRLSSSRW